MLKPVIKRIYRCLPIFKKFKLSTLIKRSAPAILIESYEKKQQVKIRKLVHIGVSVLLVFVIILFKHALEDNVISSLLKVASYTYGPLLGLFAFGIFTKYNIKENFVPLVALFSLVITAILDFYALEWFDGYKFGYELLILNGLITFLALFFLKVQTYKIN